jgi:hypothetical protein
LTPSEKTKPQGCKWTRRFAKRISSIRRSYQQKIWTLFRTTFTEVVGRENPHRLWPRRPCSAADGLRPTARREQQSLAALIELDRLRFLRMTAMLSSFYESYMDLEDLATRIRDACIEAVLQAYEDAGVQGLCAEGRWEAAVSALKAVELAPLLREFKQASEDSSAGL